METLTTINPLDPITLETQEYSSSDENLISNFTLTDIPFTSDKTTIEYHIYDFNNTLINSELNFKKYSLIDNNLVLDPKDNLKSYGFEEGQYKVIYNFISPILSSNPDNVYYLSEISPDRTEVRLSSTLIDPLAIIEGYNNFISQSNSTDYFLDFYLNFDENNLIISNNILLDDSIEDNPTILIKLYEPLPNNFDLNSQLWVVEKIADSIAYSVENITYFPPSLDVISLKGPNLNIPLKDRVNNSTEYYSNSTLTQATSSFLSNQLSSLLKNNSVTLNIDYSDYSNFIHFSSAQTRLENFYYKLSLLDTYTSQSNLASSSLSNSFISSSKTIWDNKITDLITNFDEYEYYLYFSSGSKCWPKSNNIPPYINVAPNSTEGQNWISSQSVTASLFDSENKDSLVNSIPLYLREDPNNDQYILFVQMLGQHFDNLYLYHQEVSTKYNSDNRLDYGLSKDLISDALKDFGIKIYQNNFSTDDLYSSFLGITPNGNLLPATGSELINNYVTASASSSLIPLNDVNNEIYKRIYHNVPYLFKKKGTVAGLRALITLYGIPDTILRINEYGGKDKNNYNDWDYFQNQFNYSFFTTSSGYLAFDIDNNSYYGFATYGSSVYGPVSISPSDSLSMEFRFKTTGIPTTSGFSQSLAYITPSSALNLVLEYNGSGSISGSYSGSIPDLYNQYGTLKLIDNISNTSASVYLPFFNEDWWSILVTIESSSIYTHNLYAKNKLYNGYDGSSLGFQASSSFTSSNHWVSPSGGPYLFYLSYPNNRTILGKIYTSFSGSFQELRFYKSVLNESTFDDYVMNPYSIEGNQLIGSQSSLNSLIFRAPLGSVLDNDSTSIRESLHPAYSLNPPVNSVIASGSIYTLVGPYSFIPNREIIYLDQFPAGIKNAISDKIKIVDNILPEGDTLSPYVSIQQSFPISESYTRDTNYVEVSFSPQNEINDDIISQYGYFNIGDYIGDPRQLVNKNPTSYPDFDKLRDSYFSKYQEKYNLKDYIRLIKYFDNSLFKLIKDFTPARTNLATGITIKQHILERNRYSPAQTEYEFHNEFSASVKSFPNGYIGSTVLYTVKGETGGIMPNLNGSTSSSLKYPGAINITQSWSESFSGPTGLSYINHSSQDEFYNGELKGSTIEVTDGNLNSSGSNQDPLYGNYSLVSPNPHFTEIPPDHYYIPTNEFNQILSGSGTDSTVKQYNYELKRSAYPRYRGSRSTSPGFNLNNIGNGLGLNPNVERTTPYLLYFTNFISNNPLYKNTTSLQLKYLIDESGNTYNLSTNDDTYYNLIDGFETDKKAYANLFTGNSSFFATPKTILLSGLVYKPILYSLSSSLGDVASFSNQLDFTNAKGTTIPNAPDFALYKFSKAGGSTTGVNTINLTQAGIYTKVGTNNILLTSSLKINPYYFGTGSIADYPYTPNLIGYDSQSGWTPNPSGIPSNPPTSGYDHISYPRYNFTTTPQTSINIEYSIYGHRGGLGNSMTSPGTGTSRIRMSIYLIRNSITSIIQQQDHTILSGWDTRYFCNIDNFFPQLNDQLYPVIEYLSGAPTAVNDYIINFGNYATQFVITTNGLEAPAVKDTFWTTGSSNSTTLTSSVALGTILGGGYQQVDIPSSGLPSIDNEAVINVGDEIRFEYDESYTYKVINTTNTFLPVLGDTASFSLDITPFHTEASLVGSSSFLLNGTINFVLTGGIAPTNDSTHIYVLSGSNATNSTAALVLAINNSSSLVPYSASIHDISASNSTSTLHLYAKTRGVAGNSNSVLSGSTLSNFTGGTGDTTTSSPITVLELDRPIPNSPALNINHFLIRRKSKDVNNGITLNVKLNSSNDSGLLLPEFPTQKLKDNLPTIVQDLSSKNLI